MKKQIYISKVFFQISVLVVITGFLLLASEVESSRVDFYQYLAMQKSLGFFLFGGGIWLASRYHEVIAKFQQS